LGKDVSIANLDAEDDVCCTADHEFELKNAETRSSNKLCIHWRPHPSDDAAKAEVSTQPPWYGSSVVWLCFARGWRESQPQPD